ncbi:MAG: hypothetical protein ACRD1X_14595 [Vicinamibacteria bacterium]
MELLIPIAIVCGITIIACAVVWYKDENRKAYEGYIQNQHPAGTSSMCAHGILKWRNCPRCVEDVGKER